MQAVVVELRGRKAAVLGRDGIVRVVENENYTIGQIVTLEASWKRFVRRHALPAAAAFAVVLGAGGTATAYAYPFSVVTVDAGPSLRYSVNVFGRVLDVQGYDEESADEAKELVGTVKGKKIGEAVGAALDRTETGAPCVLTVSSRFGGDAGLKETLEKELRERFAAESAEDGKDFSESVLTVSPEELKEADRQKVSPGRERYLEKLEEARPQEKPEEPEGPEGRIERPEGSGEGTSEDIRESGPEGGGEEGLKSLHEGRPESHEEGPEKPGAAEGAGRGEDAGAAEEARREDPADVGENADHGEHADAGQGDGRKAGADPAAEGTQLPENAGPGSSEGPASQQPGPGTVEPAADAPDGGSAGPEADAPDGETAGPAPEAPDAGAGEPGMAAGDSGSGPEDAGAHEAPGR